MTVADHSKRARKILVIFNPAAGWRRRRKLDRFVDALRAHSCMVDVLETTAPGDATRFAANSPLWRNALILIHISTGWEWNVHPYDSICVTY